MRKSKRITVAAAARILGKPPQFVREGLKSQRLPIGTAVKYDGSSKWTYHISEHLLELYVGGGC